MNEIANKDEVHELTPEIIKKYICPQATEQEVYMFLQMCKAQGLNPFLREAYLIKYGEEKASMVVGKETFTKRADRLPDCDGMEAGIIILDNAKNVSYRNGAFIVTGEELLGGWANVYRKNRTHPYRIEVSLKEYERYNKKGELIKAWREMPATMIRKCFHRNTIIETKDGPVKISEIVNKRLKLDILSIDKKTQKQVWGQIVDWQKIGTKNWVQL